MARVSSNKKYWLQNQIGILKPYSLNKNNNICTFLFQNQNGHTAQSIARQLGRPAILGALNRSSRLDADQPLNDV